MAENLRTVRFPLMLTPDEVKQIDDWRFANRIGTRAGAMRRLCQMALEIQGDSPSREVPRDLRSEGEAESARSK